MKVITLLENTACDETLCHAHGLSQYIETAQHKILFDMGPDDGFVRNAQRLGVDLSAVDIAFLSHGHFDHGGGLRAFFAVNDHARVYLHAAAFGGYYAVEEDGAVEYIGIDPTLLAFENRFVRTSGVTKIDGELTLFDDVSSGFAAMDASARLKEKTADGAMVPDAFRHEQDLLIREGTRAVVFGGCAHRGVVNIRHRAEELLGWEVDAVVSGFHLFQLKTGDAAADALIARTGEALLQGGTVYYTGHCTGEYAFEKLHDILGERLRRISGGVAFSP